LTRLFWRNFFSLVLVFVAVAEWVCVAWLVATLAGARFATPVHVAGPLLVYVLNRLIVIRPVTSTASRRLRRVYTGVAFASMFGFVFLLIVVLAWGVARTGLEVVDLATGRDGMPTQALARVALAIGTGGLLAIGATIAYGYGIGIRKLWTNVFEVPIPGLDPRLDGMRVAQISDIHLGPYMPPERIAAYVERVNALAPDLVVITGDITDGLDHAPATFPALAKLRAPLGVVSILGNHDVYAGADDVTRALERYTDFIVLRDETTSVERDGARLHIIGLNDRGMDWARGVRHCAELDQLSSALPPSASAILLSHRPDIFDHAARLGIPLVLAGHTHGGQLALPWRGGRRASLAHFMTRYPRGTYRANGSFLHVNLGLGITAQPIRIASPREITLITLRSTPARRPT
jgi:predicted MPP superfamily phosphohydrolase